MAMARGACWVLQAMVVWSCLLSTQLPVGNAVLSEAPEQCDASGCTLNNAYKLWNDRSTCKAAMVVYPTTEAEIVAAVADAARANQKIKVATMYGHSTPKVACPGSDSGLIISSRNYNAIVRIDKPGNTVTAQSGITMRALVDGIAAEGLALTAAPLFDGVTLGGVTATGASGSSLWGKGGALHEYVVAMTLVTPATAAEGFAVVRELAAGDPDLNAARVHLGVLGVVSTVTLQVEPLFKANVTLQVVKGDVTGADILKFAKEYENGEVTWYPGFHQVIYKLNNHVPMSTPGNGQNNFIGFQSQLRLILETVKSAEILAEKVGCRKCKCALAWILKTTQEKMAYGYEKKKSFLGTMASTFPVIGDTNFMTTAGACLHDSRPYFYCSWDQRVKGPAFFEAGAALPFQNIGAFIDDVKALRDLAPTGSLCDMDFFTGILFRFVKKTETYIGTGQEDTVTIDFTWNRGNDGTTPRLDMDVFQEIEQLAFDKYGARPHWGKNRNYVFDNAWQKYPNLEKFLAVKKKFDPYGLFSNDWSNAILGISGSTVRDDPFCAIEGNCKCFRDEHCAPKENYFCSAGLIYPNAKVCRSL